MTYPHNYCKFNTIISIFLSMRMKHSEEDAELNNSYSLRPDCSERNQLTVTSVSEVYTEEEIDGHRVVTSEVRWKKNIIPI